MQIRQHRTPRRILGNRKTLCKKGFFAPAKASFLGGSTAKKTQMVQKKVGYLESWLEA
jgi:hypothetical protein